MTFAELHIDTKGKTAGSIKTKCPKCSHDRKGAKDLSVNIAEGVWHCHNPKCAYSGSLEAKKQPEKPQYFKPVFKNNTALSDNAVRWFQGRAITQATLNAAKVGEGIEAMPGKDGWKDANTIQFHYFRKGELVNTKYRTGDKRFKMVKDAELICYNLDSIEGYSEIIITEGEIDCLSFIEAGYDAVVSVPNGASKGNSDLAFIANSFTIEQMDGFSRVYLATDNDEPGIALRELLIGRFGRDKVMLVEYPADCKDANDVLKFHGKEGVYDLINNAKGLPLEDVLYLRNYREQMRYNFQHGTPKGTTTYFTGLDPHFTWKPGEITLFHGIPNHGKSAFALQLMLAKSFKEGAKWAVFGPENFPPEDFYNDLIHAYIGKTTSTEYKGRGQMLPAEYERGMDFIDAHFFYIYPEAEAPTPEYVNRKFRELIHREGITGCLTDPVNQMERQFGSQREDQYLGDFLREEKRFALKYNVHKLLIAHPKTLSRNKSGIFEAPTVYDLSGGSMWANKCDNIICIHRPNFFSDPKDTTVEIHVQKIKKQKLVGIPGTLTMEFDRKQNRYMDYGITPFNAPPEYTQSTLPGSTFEQQSANSFHFEEAGF